MLRDVWLVEHLLERGAREWPEKVALVCGRSRLSYRQLDTEADRVARLLVEHGVEPGDRVAIYLENSVEAVVAVFAALKAGAVFVVISPATRPGKLAFMLDDAAAVVLVCDSRKVPPLGAGGRVPSRLKLLVACGQACASFEDLASISFGDRPETPGVPGRTAIDLDLAALIYTSGSSGLPKGVMLTHLNVLSAVESITSYLANRASDVILSALPLSFDYGLYQVFLALRVGATLVLERGFTYPRALLEAIARERVTALPIVPTMAAILLKLDLRSHDFSSLRYVTSTGAVLPPQHIAGLRRALPHVDVFSMYGLTECKRVSYLQPELIDARPDSVGRGMPNEEVWVVDEAGARLGGGVGELVVRGSNVMEGYWRRQEDTDAVLRLDPASGDRVLYSGDLFRIDADGFLHFIGRRDDMIKTSGQKVSPREVENVLTMLDGVAEAAVFGVPDEILGEAVTAFITVAPGCEVSEVDVRRHCAAHLEDLLVPRSIHVVDALPTSANGKIAKNVLRAGDPARHIGPQYAD